MTFPFVVWRTLYTPKSTGNFFGTAPTLPNKDSSLLTNLLSFGAGGAHLHGDAGGFMGLDDSTESYRAKMTGHRAKKMNFPRQGECVLTTSHVLPNPSRASERECP